MMKILALIWRRLTKTKCPYCGREMPVLQADCGEPECDDQDLQDRTW